MNFPHTVTLKRRDFSSDETQYANTEKTVLTGIKALISPATAVLEATMMGPAEVYGDMIFLEPGVDVRGGDILIDEQTKERWQVGSAPKTLRNPVTWETDHIEVTASRIDTE